MTNLDPEEQEILEAFESDRLTRTAKCMFRDRTFQ